MRARAAAALALCATASARYVNLPGVASPQMGYNSWYDAYMNPSSAAVLETAAVLKSSGLFAAGYRYVNLDDGIVLPERDATTHDLVPTPAMGSFKTLSDALHAEGFLFGVYTDRGTKTCGGRAAAQGFEAQDAAFYARNGVDYVKEDSCSASQDHATAFAQYAAMRDGLDATGRDTFFSLCGWNAWYSPVMRALGNSARIGPDDINWNGVLTDIDDMLALAANGGPGAWNDPCLLLGREGSGKEDQTDQQSRFQFTAWALLAAPMLLSQSVVNMSASRLETYLNAEVIAVGQDKRGAQGVLLAGGALSLAPRGLAAHLARRHNGAVPDPRVALDAAARRALRGSAWAGGDGNTPVTLAACATPAATAQVWAWNVLGAGYLSNAATDLCLNIDDCGSALIAFTCVTAGGTCCGAACYDGLRYTLGADGALRSPAAPGQCVTGAPLGVQLALAPCTGAPAQRWAHNAAGQLVNAGGGCLTVGDGAPARTAVIGRPLIDGSWALGLFNAGLGAADVVCDAACLAGMGFEPGQGFAARDLYAHADLPNVPAGANVTALALPGDGGVALIKLTPLFDAPLPPPPAREL